MGSRERARIHVLAACGAAAAIDGCHPAFPHDEHEEIALTGRAAFPLKCAREFLSIRRLEPLRMLPRGTVHFEPLAVFAFHHLLEVGSYDRDFPQNGGAQKEFLF
jgi:hypothetical protein